MEIKNAHFEKQPVFIVLTNSSSMLVWHFSRFILFMATRSCLGVQRAACTTAVAPLPGITGTKVQSKEESTDTQLEAYYLSNSGVRPAPLFHGLRVYVTVFIFHACWLTMT